MLYIITYTSKTELICQHIRATDCCLKCVTCILAHWWNCAKYTSAIKRAVDTAQKAMCRTLTPFYTLRRQMKVGEMKVRQLKWNWMKREKNTRKVLSPVLLNELPKIGTSFMPQNYRLMGNDHILNSTLRLGLILLSILDFTISSHNLAKCVTLFSHIQGEWVWCT